MWGLAIQFLRKVFYTVPKDEFDNLKVEMTYWGVEIYFKSVKTRFCLIFTIFLDWGKILELQIEMTYWRSKSRLLINRFCRNRFQIGRKSIWFIPSHFLDLRKILKPRKVDFLLPDFDEIDFKSATSQSCLYLYNFSVWRNILKPQIRRNDILGIGKSTFSFTRFCQNLFQIGQNPILFITSQFFLIGGKYWYLKSGKTYRWDVFSPN